MKSPFVDALQSNLETYEITDEIYNEVGSAGPFLNPEEIEGSVQGRMGFESEDLVDEQEDEVDLSASETGDPHQTEGESEEDYMHSQEVAAYEEETPSSILSVEPLAIPESKPVPFAPPPEPGSYWPVISSNAKGREVAFQGPDKKYRGNPSRRFLASRTDGDRYHAGIDLYANHRDPIVACEDGTIVNFYHFYRSTYALLVEGNNKVINYGEVEKDSLTGNKLKIGDKVKAGQVIAFVGRMYTSSMLHFETYTIGTRSNKRFKVGGTAPKELLNPSRYLLFLQRDGLQGKGGPLPLVVPGTADSSEKNWAKAIELNRYYSNKLPWIQHVYLINDLLLKATGQSGVSLGEEAFAEAVAAWQLKNGFSQKAADGVIGPNTWKKMQTVLGIKTVTVSEPSGVRSPDKSIVSNILKYTEVIEKYSSAYKINSNLVRGIIAAESGGNALSGKGKSGYKGLMQAERTEDQLQPDTSVKTGIDKFIKFRDKTLNPWFTKLGITRPAEDDENYLKACLSCYNAGPVTALKAIQYAHQSGNWRQWLSAENYLRALVFSGGYDRYAACNATANSADIDRAKAERMKYRFKTSGWRTEPDPALWSTVASVINPITRCWIETKYKNTPGYLDKFIFYFKYFQSNPVARELEGAEYESNRDVLTYGEDRFQNEDINSAMRDEDEIVDEEEVEWEEETDFEGPFSEHIAHEQEDEEEELEEQYDEYEGGEDEGVENFAAEDESDYDAAESEDEVSIDKEEWEEDWSAASRMEAEYDSEQSPSDLFYADSELDTDREVTSPSVVNRWLNSVVSLKKKFADEPDHNLDQLPIPPWVDVEAFYKSFGEKHGGDAKTIIGDASKKVNARYFVLHDTAVAADFTLSRIKGKGIHLWLNAQSPVVLGNDWHVKGLGVKLERRKNTSFVHVEITRDKQLQKAVQQKTKGKKVSAEQFAKEGGVRKFGTYYTDKQYELLAYAYLVASIRRGKFLTVTIHREVDRSVVVKRKNGQYGYGHDDPQFFDIDYFYGIICRILAIAGTMTFGIQSARVLGNKQSNSSGYVNTFIPFVTGDAEAANQYGEPIRLSPGSSKYKVVKLKYGYYYDATRLKNQFQEAEISEEVNEKDPHLFSSEVRPGLSSDVPALIAEDPTWPGYTCYVRVDLGKANYPLNMTGIYVPEAFDPKQPVDVVLYLHGMTGTFPGGCSQIIDYWGVSELPKYDLRIRQDVNASGRNVVLVAPSLGDSPNKYQNYLSGKKQGLDSYLDKVLAAVNAYIVKKRFKSDPISFRNVVLAAHSAGGMQMLKIAIADNPTYGPRISECWGFDSLYSKVVDPWVRWATKNSSKKLMIYYQSTTMGNAALLDREAKKLPNVFVQKSPAKNHYWVVRHHLKDRIMKMGQAGLAKDNF